jgi:hypothetical protein
MGAVGHTGVVGAVGMGGWIDVVGIGVLTLLCVASSRSEKNSRKNRLLRGQIVKKPEKPTIYGLAAVKECRKKTPIAADGRTKWQPREVNEFRIELGKD